MLASCVLNGKMQTVTTDLYKLRYDVFTACNQVKTITQCLTIPRFTELCKQRNLEIITDINGKLAEETFDKDLKFQIRIKILGRRGQLIEYYYLSPRYVALKTVMSRNENINNYHYNRQRSTVTTIIATDDYRFVEANVWNFLTYEITENIDFKREVKFEFMINMRHDSKQEIARSRTELSKDFENVFNNPVFSDVTITSTEGVEFRGHKVVLATRSAVLKAHFEHKMLESLTNIVNTELTKEVLHEMLLYMYTEEVPKLGEMTMELLMAADFYQLNELKNMCETEMHHKLTVNNVMGILDLAQLYSAKKLMSSCYQYINNNDSKAIVKTSGWKEVKNAEVFKGIAEYIINN